MNTITAHGKTYQTAAEAQAAWNALEALNNQPGVGPSDGRVTEQIAIEEALEAAKYREALANTKARNAAPASRLNPALAEYVAEAQARINRITANKNLDDGKYRYLKFQDEAGRITRREYKTELGFNKAYIAAARAGMDILIAE